MLAPDLALLTEAAREAGALALRYFDGANRVWDKPGGAGPVSEADIAVDTMLRERLTGARPDYGWLSEETEDGPERLSRDRCFIVDPIDGTRAFLDGGKDWSHSLAVVEGRIVTAAAVFVPRRDQLYAAARGEGTTLNGAPIAVSETTELDGATLLATRPNMDPKHWRRGGPPPVERHFRSSLAYRLCLVAEGRFDAMLTLRPAWEWDIAAGVLIVEEAGGTATDPTGATLTFNRRDPRALGVLAGGAIHGRLLAEIA